MKAVVLHEYGEPEVLRFEDVPDPSPAAGEVVVEVHSVSINRSFDLLLRRNGNNRGATLPLVMGADPSGIVSELGAGVSNVRIGDRVAITSSIRCGECKQCRAGNESACRKPTHMGVHRWGGYAEYVCAPERAVIPIPGGLPFADATVITRHAPAALNLLDDKAEIQPGEWALVMGAAGALGSFCVQVAKQRGATVIAAAGTDARVQAVIDLGADFGVNYRAHDLEQEVLEITDGEGVDVVCENIGDPTLWPGAFNSLAQCGRLVTMGAHGGGKVELDVRRLYGKRLRVIGAAGVTRDNVRRSLDMGAAGEIKALIDSVMPLAKAAEAHRRLENENPPGKVILDPTLPA